MIRILVGIRDDGVVECAIESDDIITDEELINCHLKVIGALEIAKDSYLHHRWGLVDKKEAKDSPEKTCTWTEAYEGNGPWESTCGEAWGLEEGNPKENGMNYCPFCGLRLEMKLYEEAKNETR